MSNVPVDPDELRDPMSPRDQIMANIAVIKDAIKSDWVRMAKDAMTPEDRENSVRKSKIGPMISQLLLRAWASPTTRVP